MRKAILFCAFVGVFAPPSVSGQISLNQLSNTVVNLINGKLNTSDTTAFANGIRASIQTTDCVKGIGNFGTVTAGSTGTFAISYGRTINDAVVKLTLVTAGLISDIQGVIYVSSVGTTAAQANFKNTSALSVPCWGHWEVCPN